MRELTRSMIRFSWAMPLLGMNQVASLVVPGEGRRPIESAVETLEALAEAAYRQMSPRLRDLYDQGDKWQRQAIDAAFKTLDASARSVRETAEDVVERAGPRPVAGPSQPPARSGAGAAPDAAESRQPAVTEGWGPVPPAGQ